MRVPRTLVILSLLSLQLACNPFEKGDVGASERTTYPEVRGPEQTQSSPGAGVARPLEPTEEPSGLASPPPTEVAEVQEVNADSDELVRVWVGLECELPDNRLTTMAFSVDGAPVQELRTRCNHPGDGGPPGGGQFSFRVAPGEHVLRLEDEAHDASAHERLYLTRDAWVRVSHRVMPEAGHLTTIQASFEPDPGDLGDPPARHER